MKKGKYLYAGGKLLNIEGNISVGNTLTYGGYGNILASAIKRKSKNNYLVSMIFVRNFAVIGIRFSSMGDAIRYLQSYYNLQGFFS